VKVVVNGEVCPLGPGTTLGAVVDGLGRGRRGVAAAVNAEVVPAGRWDATVLADDDEVEILTAAQGG
jgi:sulfur carrier protein